MRYVGATALVTAVSILILVLPPAIRDTNLSLLYLLVVLGVGILFGTGPAVLAALLASVEYHRILMGPSAWPTDLDAAEWIILSRLTVTAVVTGQLASVVRARSREAAQRARESAALANASLAVAAHCDGDTALREVLFRLMEGIQPEAAAIVRRGDDAAPEVVAARSEGVGALPDFAAGGARAAIDWVLEHRQPIGWDPDAYLPQQISGTVGIPASVYLPLRVRDEAPGVLYLHLQKERRVSPEQWHVVTSLANLAAVVLERERLGRAATQAQALAEADRLKTALLSMVSHNFRSPLTSVLAGVAGLRQNGLPADPQDACDLIEGMEHELGRLNRMVTHILALSRLESDTWRPRHEPIPVIEIIGAVRALISAESNRRIHVSLDPGLPEVRVDPVQIREALYNLLENALKYAPQDSPIEFRASRHGEWLALEVLDRGPGIPEGAEERIFERFYRAGGPSDGGGPGIGLGLTVSRGLVEAHGGTLTAGRRAGGGAVFRALLPLEAGEREPR